MELAHPGGVVLKQGGVQEWVNLAGEERSVPEKGQVQKGSVYVLNVA